MYHLYILQNNKLLKIYMIATEEDMVMVEGDMVALFAADSTRTSGQHKGFNINLKDTFYQISC